MHINIALLRTSTAPKKKNPPKYTLQVYHIPYGAYSHVLP